MLQHLRNFAKIYSLPILSGIFIGTTYIPFPPWALGFCLVPLWLFWHRNQNNAKRIFWGGWISQFILNLIGFHWVAHTCVEFGGFPPIVGGLILVLFASVAHLYYPIAGLIWYQFAAQKNHRYLVLLLPLVFAVCESFYPTIFFWHLGYPWLWASLPGAQMAEWVGFYGLNLITLFINLLVLIFVLNRKKRFILAALLLFLIPQGLGLYLKKSFQEGDKTLTTLVVQANIGNAIKVEQDKGPRFHEYILRKFSELTASGLEKNPEAQLILWPETAYPTRVTQTGRKDFFQHRLIYSIQSFERPLLTGAYEEDENGVYNSMVLFNKNGQFIQSYKKTMLLAFGEYFPGASYYPPIKKWFPMVSDFSWGTGPEILRLDNPDLPTLGAQICYESLFDYNSRVLFDKNTQVIVNVTNDSWFGYAFEPYQHLYMTLARAIEFRIPLIRSTNTGISAAISASGDISDFSPRHQEWAGVFKVNYKSNPEPTIYSYYAGYWPYILLLLLTILLFGGRFARKP
ncbi:apolipoprotein N-acyltransferase [bacterium]|nr:apolipoprotein N-acyltransferase [bacterium]